MLIEIIKINRTSKENKISLANNIYEFLNNIIFLWICVGLSIYYAIIQIIVLLKVPLDHFCCTPKTNQRLDDSNIYNLSLVSHKVSKETKYNKRILQKCIKKF